MHHWVFLACSLAEVTQHRRYVGALQEIRTVIDEPRDTIIEVVASYLLEELSQKWVRLGNSTGSINTGEGRLFRSRDTCGEQPVYNGLCVHIRELVWSQRGQQGLAEGFKLLMK